jgi:hypothetical protein
MRSIALVVVLVVTAVSAEAQTVYRIKGTTRAEDGAPVGAAIKGEALVGFRGDQFVGQKDLAIAANEKGEWNMLGLTAGVWKFTASSPGKLPSVVVLPVKFAQRQMQSAQGGQLSWNLPITMVADDKHPGLKQAAGLAMEGRATEAVQFLSGALLPDATLEAQCAAGQIALIIDQTGLAQQIFQMLQKADARNGCAPLGLASIALMTNNWDGASKMLWTARDLVPREQRPALAAAIAELQQVASTK